MLPFGNEISRPATREGQRGVSTGNSDRLRRRDAGDPELRGVLGYGFDVERAARCLGDHALDVIARREDMEARNGQARVDGGRHGRQILYGERCGPDVALDADLAVAGSVGRELDVRTE